MSKFRSLLFFCSMVTFIKPIEAAQYNADDFLDFDISQKSMCWALSPRTKEFERLEFLGDRVLGLATAHFLSILYPRKKVEELAPLYEQLVSNGSLADLYEMLEIDQSQLDSECYNAPKSGKIAHKMAADIIEAFLGAIYLDCGLGQAREFIERLFKEHYEFEESHLLKGLQALSPKVPLSKNFVELQDQLGYRFKNPKRLKDAFQHTSVGGASYALLNFIGVRAMALAIAGDLYKTHQEFDQGSLTNSFIRTISNASLCLLFEKWHLRRYLSWQGQGLISIIRNENVPKRISADTIRALIGAVYLDGQWKDVQDMCHVIFRSKPQSKFVIDEHLLSSESSEESEEVTTHESILEALEKLGLSSSEESFDEKNESKIKDDSEAFCDAYYKSLMNFRGSSDIVSCEKGIGEDESISSSLSEELSYGSYDTDEDLGFLGSISKDLATYVRVNRMIGSGRSIEIPNILEQKKSQSWSVLTEEKKDNKTNNHLSYVDIASKIRPTATTNKLKVDTKETKKSQPWPVLIEEKKNDKVPSVVKNQFSYMEGASKVNIKPIQNSTVVEPSKSEPWPNLGYKIVQSSEPPLWPENNKKEVIRNK